MESEERISPILAFLAGFFVAKNWPKIEGFLKPYLNTASQGSAEAYSSLLTFLAQQKEKVEDMMAESEIRRRKEEAAGEEVVSARGNLQQSEDLAKRVVDKHPEGIPLRKIAEEMDVHPVRLARPIKELLEKNEIRKEGTLYFPMG